MAGEEFFQIVDQRNTDTDGTLKDPNLRRRMSHPWCLECQDQYRKKFPDNPFEIECEGIFSDIDFQEISTQTDIPIGEVRDCLDRVYWAETHIAIPNEDGDMVPFLAREYQAKSLNCTARKIVDRWGRGNGKTVCGELKEIHAALTRKNYQALIVCPAKHQAQKWFDDIVAIIDGDPELKTALVRKIQAPFFKLKFANGSSISIFTAGSSSGRSGDSIRSQSPRRVRVDEQDYLNENDYSAIIPLTERYPDSEFQGSSTPTGARHTFWEMCTKYSNYKEFHFPASMHPDWSEEKEKRARLQARTDERYRHEYEAEFGDLESGVFKSVYLDLSLSRYEYTAQSYSHDLKYFMGVDWNGKGTGTRIRVVSYNPATQKRRMVDHLAVDISTEVTMQSVIAMNRKWHCEAVYIDRGFGFVQDELLRKFGQTADMASEHYADDRKLYEITTVDFGATMETNRLVSRRPGDRKALEADLKRKTKAFMVEGAVMVVENGQFEYSFEDKLLDEQMRAYVVQSYTAGGSAKVYASAVGDHDLDATLLALLAVEQRYGVSYVPRSIIRTAGSMSLLPGFGQHFVINPAGHDLAGARQSELKDAGIPSRAIPENLRSKWMQRQIGSQGGLIATPMRGVQPIVPSRTSVFTGGRGGQGVQGGRPGSMGNKRFR